MDYGYSVCNFVMSIREIDKRLEEVMKTWGVGNCLDKQENYMRRRLQDKTPLGEKTGLMFPKMLIEYKLARLHELDNGDITDLVYWCCGDNFDVLELIKRRDMK